MFNGSAATQQVTAKQNVSFGEHLGQLRCT